MSQAHATQSLEEFIAGAKRQNFDAREQAATNSQRQWEKAAALGKLLPSFTARGTYTRNQYQIEFPVPNSNPPQMLAITPYNQFDAQLTLDVPIIDLANFARYNQAKKFAEASDEQYALVGTDVDRAVARSYYSFIGSSALVEAAGRTLKNAEDNAALVQTRRDAGVATDLDLARAKANVEQARQNVADAELGRSLAGRTLQTLSGLEPSPATEFPQDDLRSEGPLESWLDSKDTPSDKVQRKLEEAAAAGKRSAAYSLMPTLSANATERLTNATGFTGRWNVFALQAVLQWRLDYATYANAQAQAAASELQKVKAERARRGLEDGIYEAYHRVDAGIVKSRSARAQASAANQAAELALQRYEAGVSTQLDVTQAQKDAFMAEASRIQADADLESSRVALRVIAGKSPILDQNKRSALPAESAPPSSPSPAAAPSPEPTP